MLADYLVVRKRKLKVQDLYIGDSRSIYWYQFGFHWRAAAAWVLGTWPTFPGFVMVLRDPITTSRWADLFKIAFLVGEYPTSGFDLFLTSQYIGLSISFVSFVVICKISPPPHLSEGLDYLVSDYEALFLSGYLLQL